MDVALLRRAQTVFDEVVELDPADRASFLEVACGRNTELKELVEALLERDREGSEAMAVILERTGLEEKSRKPVRDRSETS